MESIDHKSYHLLETMFIEGYQSSKDKMLFLRMAHIPFEIPPILEEEPHLYLKSIQIETSINVGNVTPAFGEAQLVHQMFPHELVETVHQLHFLYVHHEGVKQLSLQELYDLHIDEIQHTH